jgi:methylmalonyl-CoA mutase
MSSAPAESFPLAAEFPPATREDWLRLVADVLKGADFHARLVATTHDGLRVDPIFPRAAHAQPILGRPAGSPWQILSRIELPDPAAANAEARHEIENGAAGLLLVFDGAIGARGYGLEASRPMLMQLLGGIEPDRGIALDLDLGPDPGVALLLAEALSAMGFVPAKADIRFGFDPFGPPARNGGFAAAESPSMFATHVQELMRRGFRGPFAAADGRPVHDAGGSEAQELAFVLAGAVAWLRALEGSGLALEDARRTIYFRLAADADQLLTMAKLRALRRLWARVEEACSLAPAPAFVSAETAWRILTKRDPWVNVLRNMVAAFAAGLGGANAVSVLPFTAALGLPDRFARRLARNTQLVLIEEASLGRVGDPAAGSGGIEALTDAVAAAAWIQFQEIEAAGGLAAALEAGLVQRHVAAACSERGRAVATRREALTGTSEFPHLAELPVAVLDAPRSPERQSGLATKFAPLALHRLAEQFERLRDASDRQLEESGSRPKVFLANLGPLAAFTSRATFAKNFFEAGGIEAVTNEGFAAAGASTDRCALAAAFNASRAGFACLCSSDEIYGREAGGAAEVLTRAGAHRIYLVGRPGDAEAALRTAGITDFVQEGCDALAILEAAYQHLDR